MPDRDEFTSIRATDYWFRNYLVRHAHGEADVSLAAAVEKWLQTKRQRFEEHFGLGNIAIDMGNSSGLSPIAAAGAAKARLGESVERPSRWSILAERAVWKAVLVGDTGPAAFGAHLVAEFVAHFVIHAREGTRDLLARESPSDANAAAKKLKEQVFSTAGDYLRANLLPGTCRLPSSRKNQRSPREQIHAGTNLL